jgi:hypothetical protein
MNSADSDSNDGHLGPRSDREWRRQYGPAIGAEVVQRLPCGWRRGCRSLRAKLCFDRGNVFQYWRTKLEEACVSCFAPQIPAWNDSDDEALALVFAQEHGAGLEAWQTRSHREDSDSVNPGSNPGPSATNPSGRQGRRSTALAATHEAAALEWASLWLPRHRARSPQRRRSGADNEDDTSAWAGDAAPG